MIYFIKSFMINRIIKQQIVQSLFKKKAIILYGPRQVGKTTLVKEIAAMYDNTQYINCDDPVVRSTLTNPSIQTLKELFDSYSLVVLDEAQRVENIWITLKLLIDELPEVQVIATWSSSFELANKITEPLTGRIYLFHLYPFSREELQSVYTPLERKTVLHTRLIYGMYPDIVLWDNSHLKLIVDSYLYKDILEHQNVKKAHTLVRLLQAIALQLGSEVSYHELAQLCWIDPATVERYIDLLEKSFVLFRLPSFSRNIRNELKKSKKIYFRDNGVRNTIINAYNPIELRTDIWALWENFCISERIKYLAYHQLTKNTYFRRTKQQQEIDYLEEENMQLDAFEFKWSSKKQWTIPSNFASTYQHTYQTIHPGNFEQFF